MKKNTIKYDFDIFSFVLGAITSEKNLTLQRSIIDYSLKKINTRFSRESIQFEFKIIEISSENSFQATRFGKMCAIVTFKKFS